MQFPPRDVASLTFEAFRVAYRLLVNFALSMWGGHQNNGGIFTLTASAATSTLTDARISATSSVVFEPVTANAAAERGAGTMYVSESGRVHGSIVVTHANNAQTDRTFRYLIGGT